MKTKVNIKVKIRIKKTVLFLLYVIGTSVPFFSTAASLNQESNQGPSQESNQGPSQGFSQEPNKENSAIIIIMNFINEVEANNIHRILPALEYLANKNTPISEAAEKKLCLINHITPDNRRITRKTTAANKTSLKERVTTCESLSYDDALKQIKSDLIELGYSLNVIRTLKCPNDCPVLFWHLVILTDTILSSEKSRESDFKALCDQHHPFIFPYLHHLISNGLITPSKEFLFSNHASWAMLTMGWLRMIFMTRKVNFDPISWGIYELNENTELFKLFNEDCSLEPSTSKENKNGVEKTSKKNKNRVEKTITKNSKNSKTPALTTWQPA